MEITAAVLLLNLPPSALAGIDLLSFTTTPRFRGVKDLPSGWHFVFTGTSTAFSIRHGIWFRVQDQHELTITSWHQQDEQLSITTDEAEKLRWRANIGEVWEKGLTPYRQSSASEGEAQDLSGDWLQLTSYISASLLRRITQGDSESLHLTSASSAAQDLDDIPGLSSPESKTHPEKELRFLPIDLKRTWRADATGRERTDAAQDSSWALSSLMAEFGNKDGDEIIGELQFCFLMLLTLNNWSCLEQWKRILTLVFTCKIAVATHPDLFIRAIATLRLQLMHCKDADGGLIDLADEGGSLLKSLLARFRKSLHSLPRVEEVQDVLDELDDLEAYLRDEHGWQFGGSFAKSGVLDLEDGEQVRMDTTAYDEDDETGEWAPQVVDLTPEQARLLGVEDAVDLRAKMGETSLHGRDAGNDPDGGVLRVPDRRSIDDEDEEDEEEEDEELDDLEDMDARY
jgi:A1 cistron-splicing factor AAR2